MALDYREHHRREALVGTVIVHVLLLLLFLFTVFKGPDPPLTEMGGGGVELNYGVDEDGYGDIQTLAQANNSRNTEDSRPPTRNPDPQPAPQPAPRVWPELGPHVLPPCAGLPPSRRRPRPSSSRSTTTPAHRRAGPRQP